MHPLLVLVLHFYMSCRTSLFGQLSMCHVLCPKQRVITVSLSERRWLSCLRAQTHTHTHTHKHTHTHMHTHACIYSSANRHTHKHITCTHAHSRTHTHTKSRDQSHMLTVSFQYERPGRYPYVRNAPKAALLIIGLIPLHVPTQERSTAA